MLEEDLYNNVGVMIDLAEIMLEHKHGLNDMQADAVQTIHRRSIDFIETFIRKWHKNGEVFCSYLNHDALSPITVIIGYAEVMLQGMMGGLNEPYLEAMQQLRDYAVDTKAILDEMQYYVMAGLRNVGLRT